MLKALFRKKLIIVTFMLLLQVLFILPLTISAAGTDAPLTVEVNGEPIDFDQQPVVVNDKTLVPFGKILEQLGAEFEWNGITKTVTAMKGSTTLKLTIGEAVGYVNEKAIPLEAPAITINGRTLVPARFIGESLGASIGWNGSTRTVIIELNEVGPVINSPVDSTYEPIVNNSTLNPDEAIGRIEGKDGVGIPGISVFINVTNEAASPPSTMTTDKNGYYKIWGLTKDEKYLVHYTQSSNTNWTLISHNGINYCRNQSDTFTFTNSQQPKPIVLEQVQVTGKLLDQNNKPITQVNVLVRDRTGEFMGISRFSVDDEGRYSLCGLVENESYTVSFTKFFKASSETHQIFDYQPLTFTYHGNMTVLLDLKVTVKEVKVPLNLH